MELIERIFEGCLMEFRESGIKFTMNSLADRININKETLYENIPSKRALINLVIDKTFMDIREQQKSILENNELSTLEKLEKLFRIVPSYAEILDYRQANTIKRGYPALYRKIIENTEKDWNDALELLEKAMEEGVIRKQNPTIVKMLLCGIFERLLDANELYEINFTYEAALNEMIDIIFDGLKMNS